MQEQEPDSPLKDLASVECDPVDSPAQHATDGKAVKPPPPLFSCNSYELKFDIADTNVESSELIQLDAIGASSDVPSFQIEATVEKVLYPFCHPFIIN